MEDVLAAEAISKGGRLGTIQTSDRSRNVTLGNPWAFQANTPDAARQESLRPMVSRNRIYLLK
jgi:hypothetical protein